MSITAPAQPAIWDAPIPSAPPEEAKEITLVIPDPAPEPQAQRAEFTPPALSGALGQTSVGAWELAQRQAQVLAKSTLVPKEYQNNIANCIIALDTALRLNASPLLVTQNLYIVQGRPSWSAQFMIATFNTSGRFGPIQYEFSGEEGTDTWGCRAWAVTKGTGEIIKGSLVTISIAKKEGWYNKGGSKWQTMPQQMLMYRSASWFIRAYSPEISMGLQTAEELIDTYEPQAPATAAVPAEALAALTRGDA